MNKNSLKIAFFNASDTASGAEYLIRNTVEGLNQIGCDARLYVRRVVDPKPYLQKIPYLPMELQAENTLRKWTGWNDFFFPSTRLLHRDPWLQKADVWHFHNLHGHYLSVPALSWQSRRRHIVLSPVDQQLATGYCPYPISCDRFKTGCGECPQLDLPYPGISRDATSRLWKIKRNAIHQGRFHFLLHTQYLFDYYQSSLNLGANIVRIPYGVDVETYRPLSRAACAANLGIPLSRKMVVGLFHSYILEKRKGILAILEGLQKLAQTAPGKIDVLVVGHDSDKAQALATPGLSVRTLPFLRTDTQLAEALNLCDVLLYPTRADSLSLTCLCALACGVPVISGLAGGHPEAITNHENGFLIPPDDEVGFLRPVQTLLEDPALRRRMSDCARKRALAEYDFKPYVNRLLDYYHDRIGSAFPQP